MNVFLDGVAAQYYRGIGPETQYIGPFSRMNFFIGANNSGKSIVLNLLADQLDAINRDKTKKLSPTDYYRGRETGQFSIAVGRSAEAVHRSLVEEFGRGYFRPIHGGRPAPTFQGEVQNILQAMTISGNVWVSPLGRGRQKIFPDFNPEDAKLWTKEWGAVCSVLTSASGGGINTWLAQSLDVISRKVIPVLPNIHLIPAKRTLGKRGEAFDDLSGKGLIDHLAALQNPNWDREAERVKFQKINKFLQEVTGKSDARLEVPSEREHLLVHMDNKVLPLSALGTGIHEVVLIAAFCVIHDDCIMCLEEPEIHLHPLLQRKLVRYLLENTSNQYFIATHSAALVDTPDATVFRVSNDGEQTRIVLALNKREQRRVLDDLGYLASDILQSNAVIWVEGPSDRIYLNHWIEAIDPDLREGTHYSVMFYGGALIGHLSASDEARVNFIKLRELNRNLAIIIDSDRSAESEALKPHAERLVNEFRESGGLAWVTSGREIENYVDGSRIQAAAKDIHSRIFDSEGKTGRFDNSFHFYRKAIPGGRREIYKGADKVGIASKICSEPANLDVLDLRERVCELVEMIRRANAT